MVISLEILNFIFMHLADHVNRGAEVQEYLFRGAGPMRSKEREHPPKSGLDHPHSVGLGPCPNRGGTVTEATAFVESYLTEKSELER